MQLQLEPPSRRQLLVGAAVLGAGALAFAFRGLLAQLGLMTLGAGILCFVAAPLARFYEKKLPRPVAALAALASLCALATGIVWLLLPSVYRQLMELLGVLPDSILRLAGWFDGVGRMLQRRIPALTLPEMSPESLLGPVSNLAKSTLGIAVNLADVIGRASMMAVLAFFFLCDRDRLLLRLELLLPRAVRHTAVCMGNAVCRELRLYLWGQLMVAAAVSALSTAALIIVGVRNAPVLGIIIGLLNMIPYFGPFIGGVPAVFIALGEGWQKAALTVLALSVVQQLDGSWISPRIMGSLTGFSPAAVLLGIYAGARLNGVTGMFFALPVMMACRTVFRIFVQKYENI